uniref:Uncharacterized protein n=1 Tax=Arundo donax TaxID=35708 RepID=A0A0A8Z6D7_ARUDO
MRTGCCSMLANDITLLLKDITLLVNLSTNSPRKKDYHIITFAFLGGA